MASRVPPDTRKKTSATPKAARRKGVPAPSPPEEAPQQAVLRLLRQHAAAGVPPPAEQLARELGWSPATVRKVLDDMAWDRLVERQRAGRRWVYTPSSTGSAAIASAAAPAVAVAAPVAASRSTAVPPAPVRPPPGGGSGGGGGGGGGHGPGSPGGSEPDEPRRRHRDEGGFSPVDMDRLVVSLPLTELLEALDIAAQPSLPPEVLRKARQTIDRFEVKPGRRVSVIIDLNSRFAGGLHRARHRVYDLLVRLGYTLPSEEPPAPTPAPTQVAVATGRPGAPQGMLDALSPRLLREVSGQYVFALLTPEQIRRLVALELRRAPQHRAVYRLWPDHLVQTQALAPPQLGALATIKADAARASFGCGGHGIVWAVVDSGIDGEHPHFATHGNLRDLPPGIVHVDFCAPDAQQPLQDRYGHGTHVAGIVAGSMPADDAERLKAEQIVYERDPNGAARELHIPLRQASGVAPACKLVSYKVLGDNGRGPVTNVLAALEEIYRVNGYGKEHRVHGVNLSVGYPFEPRWFACGHSPLCEVVDRLARSGVVVVAAAGNNGFAMTDLGSLGSWGQGRSMSITDPGNAERAITVGSTHRDEPHTYGVSYFSSKGPTGDGRCKPDLLAPGEKIVSCSSGHVPGRTLGAALYREDSGTSMAAPHVSGAIAAFLSVRREFIGRTEQVKALFMETALDLKRSPDLQGRGLLDLLRALHSV